MNSDPYIQIREVSQVNIYRKKNGFMIIANVKGFADEQYVAETRDKLIEIIQMLLNNK